MASSVSIDKYLNTSYRPDCDYLNGEVRERCCGLGSHARMLSVLVGQIGEREEDWGVRGLLLVRTRVAADRVRIAEVCVLRRDAPMEDVIETAPLLVIEVLQEDDTVEDQAERVRDFVGMGVGTVWVIDPQRRRAYMAAADGSLMQETGSLVVEGTEIALEVQAIFTELEDLERNG